jgi:hypothetical protein
VAMPNDRLGRITICLFQLHRPFSRQFILVIFPFQSFHPHLLRLSSEVHTLESTLNERCHNERCHNVACQSKVLMRQEKDHFCSFICQLSPSFQFFLCVMKSDRGENESGMEMGSKGKSVLQIKSLTFSDLKKSHKKQKESKPKIAKKLLLLPEDCKCICSTFFFQNSRLMLNDRI